MNNSIQLLKAFSSAERTIEFSQIPVFFVEPMLAPYLKNTYADTLGLIHRPQVVATFSDLFEMWVDQSSKTLITDSVLIKKIADDTAAVIVEARKEFEDLRANQNAFLFSDLSATLDETHALSNKMYEYFLFFGDELFNTQDEKLIHKLQEIRMDLDDLVVNQLFVVYEQCLGVIEKEIGVTKHMLMQATVKELRSFLKDPDNSLPRSDHTAFIFVDGTRYDFRGKEVDRLKEHLSACDKTQELCKEALKTQQIKGLVGNRGVVKGKVCLLPASAYTDAAHLNRLKDETDFILVTPMTRPECLLYMRNASAFITDEGGITCHAAIIAREMGKPCVIGTRIATQVLKDGDMVEVDADNGVVRIIN